MKKAIKTNQVKVFLIRLYILIISSTSEREGMNIQNENAVDVSDESHRTAYEGGKYGVNSKFTFDVQFTKAHDNVTTTTVCLSRGSTHEIGIGMIIKFYDTLSHVAMIGKLQLSPGGNVHDKIRNKVTFPFGNKTLDIHIEEEINVNREK